MSKADGTPAYEPEFSPLYVSKTDGRIVVAQASDDSPTDEPHGASDDAHGATEAHAGEAAHADEHGAFPPFDANTFGSQIVWLVISFGLLYYLMSKVALPRIATILEERNDRIADDLAEAESLKRETDAAIAAYEQSLAEARKTAHGIAQTARDEAKGEIEAERAKVEAGLEEKLTAAEAHIAEVRDSAIGEIDAIARDTAQALVQVLTGAEPADKQVAEAVAAALNREQR